MADHLSADEQRSNAPAAPGRGRRPGRVVAEVAGIVLLGALVGGALNLLSARPVALGAAVYSAAASGTALCGGGGGAAAEEGAGMISQVEAENACNACAAGFVDARGAAAYAEGHLPGAVHLPPMQHGSEAALLEPLRKFPKLIVYDDGGASGAACPLAAGVAQRLRAAGFPDVRVLDGGWAGWQRAGGPAESGACTSCASGGSEEASIAGAAAGSTRSASAVGGRESATAASKLAGQAAGQGGRP